MLFVKLLTIPTRITCTYVKYIWEFSLYTISFLETIPWKTLPWPSLFGALLLSLGMILWYIQYTLYVVHLK